MKPFNERIDGFTGQFKEQMASLYDQGYKQGYKDGSTIYGEGSLGATLAEKKGYAHGLSDAWECAREIFRMTAGDTLAVFGTIGGWVYHSAEEAMRMIKDYKEKPCANIYDEIIYRGNHRGVIIDIDGDGDGTKWVLDADGTVQLLDYDISYRTTGRRFPELKKILEQLQEGGADD